MSFKKLALLWVFGNYGFIMLLSSCQNRASIEVNSEKELEMIEDKYSSLKDDEKIKTFNSVINYYQFTKSKKSLIFMKEKIKEGDPVAINAISTARRVGIEIPLGE